LSVPVKYRKTKIKDRKKKKGGRWREREGRRERKRSKREMNEGDPENTSPYQRSAIMRETPKFFQVLVSVRPCRYCGIAFSTGITSLKDIKCQKVTECFARCFQV
jgi:hypothetical protein